MEKRVSRKVNSYTKERVIEIVRKVCGSYKTGEYTLESCCKNAGVPYRTYKDWWARYEADPDNVESKWHFLAEVAGLWVDAQEKHRSLNDEALIQKAESLLVKAVSGYEYEEVTTIYKRSIDADGNEVHIPVGLRKKKRFRHPSVSAIMFVLRRLKPEVYGEQILVIKENVKNEYDDMTIQEIDAELKRLEHL